MDQMLIDKMFIIGLAVLTLYMMIFHTEKWKAINEEGWRNIDRTGRTAAKAAKFGFGVFRFFRR